MKKLLLLTYLILPLLTLSQELINSQFYVNRVNTNPAFTGESSGSRINLNSRMQWRNVPSDPNKVFGNFSVVNASFDMPLCKFGQNSGIGGRVSQENHGQAGLQTTAGYGAYSYSIKFSERRSRSKLQNIVSSIRFGLEVGFLQRSVNDGNLIYSDQIDPIRGVVAASANSSLPLVSKLSFNSSVGGIISWNLNKYKTSAFKQLFTGYAIHNLNSPSVNLISSNSDERIAMKHTFHATAMFDNKWPVALLAHLRYMQLQGTKTNVLDIFVNGVKTSKNRSGVYPTLGGGLRMASSAITQNTHSILTAFGINWGSGNQLLLSGDMNVGGFSNASASTWELSLIFNFDNACRSSSSRSRKGGLLMGCPEF